MKTYIAPIVEVVELDSSEIADWGNLQSSNTTSNNSQTQMVSSNEATESFDSSSYRTTLWND